MYFAILKVTLLRIGLLLLTYSLCRFLFYAYNFSTFAHADWFDVALAFLLGLRFDIATILLINSLFLFLSIVPFVFVRNNVYQSLLKGLFLIINLPALFINLADIVYFPFKGKRTGVEVIGMASDVLDQSIQLAFYYWYVPLISIVLGIVIFTIYPRLKAENSIHLHLGYQWLLFVFMAAFIVLGIRGGLQLKPIRTNMAFVLQPNVLGNVVLNTPFVVIQTAQLPSIEPLHYFASQQECEAIIKKPYGNRNPHLPQFQTKPNIVMFILESFSSEYTGFGNEWQGYTPFLDSISAQGLFFKNHYSNGRVSMDAVPALLASIPALMSESYITSAYQGNSIKGLASFLIDEGYSTSFFHGGKNGTMGFDVFAKNAGYQHYLGMSEYDSTEEHFDGNWGIPDHYFFKFFCKKISETTIPFHSTIFTLSSHQPYKIPKGFEHKYTEGPVPIIRTIKYTDDALRSFFAAASSQPWFDNTIFIFTADHTQDKIQPWSIYNDYHVPLLFYAPKLLKSPAISSKITQHLDLTPSILDLLQIGTNCLPFGHSIFDESYNGGALLYDGASQSAILAHDTITTIQRADEKFDFIHHFEVTKMNSTHTENQKLWYTKELKAITQFYNNGLIENTLFDKCSTKK